MSGTVNRCHFEFVDEHKVTFATGQGQPKEMTLSNEDTSFDTLIALSVYVMNTKQTDCWPGLIELLGRHLFEFLVPDEGVRGEVSGLCGAGRVHINLSFQRGANRYAQLPWEFLSVPVGGRWSFLGKIGKDVSVTLTRHMPMQRAVATLTGDVEVLVDVNSPATLAKIDTTRLEQQLNSLEDRTKKRFKVRIRHERTLTEIREDIETSKPDIFHWSGHGDRNALFLAEADDDTIDDDVANLKIGAMPLGFRPLPPGRDAVPFSAPIEAISDLFKGHAPSLVVLDACGSDWSWQSEMLPGIAHQLLEYVPAVIAMRYPINNKAASAFAVHLYEKIAAGMALDQAFQSARNQLAVHRVDRAYGTPVLYLESSTPFCSDRYPSESREE